VSSAQTKAECVFVAASIESRHSCFTFWSTRQQEKTRWRHAGITVKVLIAYMQVLYYVGKTAAKWSSQARAFFKASSRHIVAVLSVYPMRHRLWILQQYCAYDDASCDNLCKYGDSFLFCMLLQLPTPRSYFFLEAIDDFSKVTLVLLSLVHPTISKCHSLLQMHIGCRHRHVVHDR